MLLHCDGISTLPLSVVTGSNGDPVATTALPLVHLYASTGVHSALDVGFDIGMITGRSLNVAMVVMSSSVNKPPHVDKPNRILGLNAFIVSRSDAPSSTLILIQSLCPGSLVL